MDHTGMGGLLGAEPALVVTLVLNAVTQASHMLLLALGLSLIFGVLRVLNMAHGALHVAGLYVGLSVVHVTGSWWAALIVSPLILAMFPRLAERRRQSAGLLSGGEQRMLAIARALVTNPKLLLPDELTDGLAPIVVEQLLETVHNIAAAGTAILLAEQNVHFAAALASRGYLIDKGTIRATGHVSALLADEALVASHLAL